MNSAAVHPELARAAPMGGRPGRVRMNRVQGMPATLAGLVLRVYQFAFSAIAAFLICYTAGFPSAVSFRFLLIAVVVHGLWSLLLAIVDAYGLLMIRTFRNVRFVYTIVLIDAVISSGTFAAACSCSSVTALMIMDPKKCDVHHCKTFIVAAVLAFFGWLFSLPCFFINFWSLASR
ncbi:unnamed protein product [Cuscuta epithymum]|uniref:CASP-like protein n=1 Tax=Cuscuta epithymum TaxID=186058 RepID=A0AAV0EXJ2_9ASTE|nr:unnamed protein product [Cuscuta epithymum]